MFKRIIGTKDILPDEVSSWQRIEEASRNIFSVYNYQEIRTPLIEELSLFNRSLGESAEIVQKQMFLVSAEPSRTAEVKRDQFTYALRPEGTASIARAYIENNLHRTQGPLKLYYIGAMFRLERPQKGRLRQFHHLGCEVLGPKDAFLDAEVITLADNLLKVCSIEGYKIRINSLGCLKDKEELAKILRNELTDKLLKLCDDCRLRFKRNVLRILDCKNTGCLEVIRGLDIRDRYLCSECKAHFTKTRSGLDSLKIEYEVSPSLVRGLDYYTRTVFEIIHNGLGAQNALGAGGRYDNLIQDLGGPSIGAIGFALGIERLLLVTGCQPPKAGKKLVYIITLCEEAKTQGLSLLTDLRRNGVAADTDYEGKSLKGALRRANDLGASHVLIIGEDELKNNVVTLKDMGKGDQKELDAGQAVSQITTRFFMM